jgi:uncharacterized protein
MQMKRLVFVLFVLLSISTSTFSQKIPDRPNPPRLINDFAHVLTPDQVQSLENKLVAYDDSTSTQIVIVTIPTTGDYDVEQYGLAILRTWGVGNKKTNNGIVILAAIQDRKIRIETGYGMEGAIPDITANQIIDNNITPYFREGGNYYRGFDEGVNAIMKAAAGEYTAPEGYNKKTQSTRRGLPFSVIFIIIIIILILSRGGGRGGGGMMSRRGFDPFLGGMLGGFLGSRGGGFGGGGGGWSGGGGGGGFGGFGGGSGGGGGASGSW